MMLLALFLTRQAFAQEQIFFGSGSYELKPEGRKVLDQILKQYGQQRAEYRVHLKAFCDEIGDSIYNKTLAERRAQTVRAYLDRDAQKRFGDWSLEAIGSIQGQDLAQNRRVDVAILPLKTDWSLEDFFKRNRNRALQTFRFEASTGSYIQGRQGGIVDVPAYAFVNDQGQRYEGQVEFHLQEAYTFGDMLAQNLSTTSGNRMLETGGMMYLNAYDETGKALKIAQNQNLQLSMPNAGRKLDNMSVFVANRQGDRPQQRIDWQQVSNSSFLSTADLQNLPVDKLKSGLVDGSLSLTGRSTLKFEALIPFLSRAVPAPKNQPSPPQRPRSLLNDMAEPTPESIAQQSPMRGGETNRAYRKRLKESYERQKKLYDRVQANNEKRRQSEKRALENYEKQLLQYRADSLAFVQYTQEMDKFKAELYQAFEADFKATPSDFTWNALVTSAFGGNPSPYSYINRGSFYLPLNHLLALCQQMRLLKPSFPEIDLDKIGSAPIGEIVMQCDKMFRKNKALLDEANKKWETYAYALQTLARHYSANNKMAPIQIDWNNNQVIKKDHPYFEVYLLYSKLLVMRNLPTQLNHALTQIQKATEADVAAINQAFKKSSSYAIKTAEQLNLKIEQERRRQVEARIKEKGLNTRDLQRYTATVSTLGWINCDRFYEQETRDFLVQQEEDLGNKEVAYFLVLEETRSIISVSPKDKISLPISGKVRCLGLKAEAGKGLMLLDLKTDFAALRQQTFTAQQFKPIPLDGFDKLMAQL